MIRVIRQLPAIEGSNSSSYFTFFDNKTFSRIFRGSDSLCFSQDTGPVTCYLPSHSGSLLRRLGKLSRKFPPGLTDWHGRSSCRRSGAAMGRSESRVYLLRLLRWMPRCARTARERIYFRCNYSRSVLPKATRTGYNRAISRTLESFCKSPPRNNRVGQLRVIARGVSYQHFDTR
jgi:hypothetical protein